MDGAFDFTASMRALCEDVCARLEELQHIDMNRVAVGMGLTRGRRGGILARLTPLRFEGGKLTTRRRGREWTIQRYSHDGIELLYVVTFHLPRFWRQGLEEKLATVVHELYHIHPAFNGDLRRLEGRYHAHGHSCRHYDAQMRALAQAYQGRCPSDQPYAFLREDWDQLTRRHSAIVGLRVPMPKLLPCPMPDGERRPQAVASFSRFAIR